MARHAINVLVGASIKPLQATLKKGVGVVKGFSSQASKIVAGSGGIGGAIAGAIGGISVAAGLKMGIDRFREAETANKQLELALRSSGSTAEGTASRLSGFARQMSELTGTAASEVKGIETEFARAGIVDEKTVKEATKQVLNFTAAMGGSGVSNASQFAEALKNPREGYLQLAAMGVRFTESQIDAMRSMAAVGDSAGITGVAMEALQNQFGGAAEAAGTTLDGSINKLWGSVSTLAEGVGTMLAPSINAAVDQMTEWVKGLDAASVKNVIIEHAAKLVGYLADGVLMARMAFDNLKAGANVVLAGIAAAVEGCIRGFAKFIETIEMIPGVAKGTAESIRKFSDETAGALKNAAWDQAVESAEDVREAWAKLRESNKTISFGDKLKEETNGAKGWFEKLGDSAKKLGSQISDGVGKAMDELKKKNIGEVFTKEQLAAMAEADKSILSMKNSIKNFGLDEYAKKANELKDLGATGGQVQEVKRLGAQLKGKELAQSLERPFEKFEREIAKLDQLHADGGIDDETLARAKAKITGELQSSLPDNKIQAGGAIMQGSQEARSALLSYQQASRNADPAVALARQNEILVEEAKQQTKYLRDIAKTKPQTSAFGSM